jgi:uncharacterized protein
MSEYKKPLPVIQSWTKQFWEGTKRHKFLIQHCEDCDTLIFYPRKFCPECWSSSLNWVEASGFGKIYSFTVTYYGLEERFSEDIPIIVVLVDMAEGIRVMGRLINCKPESVEIGMQTKVVFKHATDEFTLFYFELVA